MKLFWWVMAVLLLVGVGAAEIRFYMSMRNDMMHFGRSERRTVPYAVAISGEKLRSRVRDELASINTARIANIDRALGQAVVVEGVTYERNAGIVQSQGRLRDLAGPRRVLAVMDAYDQDLGYLTSAAVPVQTGKGIPVGFTVAMPDRLDLVTLSFRVLSEADRSEIASLTERDLQSRRTAVEDRATLLLDDAVEPVDLQEAEERLRYLGYVTSPKDVAVGEPAMKVVFNRFRRDHGLPVSNSVDLETFLALRVVSSGFSPFYRAQL